MFFIEVVEAISEEAYEVKMNENFKVEQSVQVEYRMKLFAHSM